MSQSLSVVLLAAGAPTTSQTGTGVDVTDFEGMAEVVQNLGAITAGSISANKLQSSPDNSVWTDITGATFGTTASQMTSVKINLSELPRYIRYVATIATGPVGLGVTLHGFKKYRP